MNKRYKFLKIVSVLLKQLNCPRFLHHFGPKKYEFRQHAVALLLKEVCKTSFRRVVILLDLFNVNVPTYSALCKSRKRIPKWIWQQLLSITAGIGHERVAVDGTGFSTSNPSPYYIKRIDRKHLVRRYIKLSALFSLDGRKFVALKIRVRPRHDIMDVKHLLKQARDIKKLYGDSGYDAEWLHELCFDNGVQTIIKPKKRVKQRFYRRKQMKNFSEKEYHQRSLIESGFGSLKRKYGSSVLAKKSKSIQSELYCRAIAHNLSLQRVEIFN
jgi:transposase